MIAPYKNKKFIILISLIILYFLFSIKLFGGGNSENDINHNHNNHNSDKSIKVDKNKYYNHERLKNVNKKININDKKEMKHENYLNKNTKLKRKQSEKKSEKNKETPEIMNNIEDFKNENLSQLFNTKCQNGGIGFESSNSVCICPFGYSGNKCEIINKDEKCTNPLYNIEYLYRYDKIENIETCKFNPSTICCWSKYRSENNISNTYLSDNLSIYNSNNLTNHHTSIKSILESYGPWDDNDKLILNYLIKKDQSKNGNYILKYNHLDYYNKQNLPSTTSRSKLAFVFLIHNIDLDSIKILLDQLYKIKHYYVIHVDKNYKNIDKINELKEFIKEYQKEAMGRDVFITKDYPNNIEIIEKGFSNGWGSIALVYSELASYTKLFDMVEKRNLVTGKSEKWSHVINLSINDFPVKPLFQLESFLSKKSNLEKNFLNEDWFQKEEVRLNRSWVECNREMVSFNFDIENHQICGSDFGGIYKSLNRSSFFEGSQWHFLTFKFAHYLISDFKSISRLFSLKFSYIPDESFFQIAKSEFNNSVLPESQKQEWERSNYRYIPWANPALAVGVKEVENDFPDGNGYNGLHNYFTRKVYDPEIKQLIINKFLKDK